MAQLDAGVGARIVALLRRAGRTRKGPETTGFVLAWQEDDQPHLSDGNFGGNLRAKSVLLVASPISSIAFVA